MSHPRVFSVDSAPHACLKDSLQRILQVLSDSSPDVKNTAYFFAVVAFLANLSFVQVDVDKEWFVRWCYEQTRGQLFCALHYKSNNAFFLSALS